MILKKVKQPNNTSNSFKEQNHTPGRGLGYRKVDFRLCNTFFKNPLPTEIIVYWLCIYYFLYLDKVLEYQVWKKTRSEADHWRDNRIIHDVFYRNYPVNENY